MDFLSTKYRRETVRQDIINKVEAFVNRETNVVDMKSFYKTFPWYRNKITYYFGSLKEFYEEIGASLDFKYVKKIKEQVERRITSSLRDELALERLEQLRGEGLTLDQIGIKYGVSKQAVNQLVFSLDSRRV